jgi:hypothetical protein
MDAVLLDVLGASDSQCHPRVASPLRLGPAVGVSGLPRRACLPGHRAAQEVLVEFTQAREGIARGGNRGPGTWTLSGAPCRTITCMLG